MRGFPVALAALALWPAAAAADPSAGEYGYHMGYGWAGMIFGPIFMILLLVAAVAVVVVALRWLGALPAAGKSGPLRTLEERFARGEIDAEEFAARKKSLSD